MGGNANYPCQKCKVGGTKQEKESDKGYNAFYEVGHVTASVLYT